MIIFDVKGRNELGDVSQKQLVIEIMGRHSNIILVDKERNMILDSIKHVSYAVNSHRAILPGQEYKVPLHKISIIHSILPEDDSGKFDFNAGKLDQQLVQHFSGISPLLQKKPFTVLDWLIQTPYQLLSYGLSMKFQSITIPRRSNKMAKKKYFICFHLEHLHRGTEYISFT